MRLWLVLALAPSVLAAAGARKSTSVRQQVHIHLYNLSGVPSDALRQATAEAERIFGNIGLDVNWDLGMPDAEEAHTTDQSSPSSVRRIRLRKYKLRSYLVVRIVRGMAAGTPAGALGLSLPDALYGVSATVFADRIESLCQASGFGLGVVLGHALAHEIGHVLIGTSEHAPTGIMKAKWSKGDFDEAEEGGLAFTKEQGTRIREYWSLAGYDLFSPTIRAQ